MSFERWKFIHDLANVLDTFLVFAGIVGSPGSNVPGFIQWALREGLSKTNAELNEGNYKYQWGLSLENGFSMI